MRSRLWAIIRQMDAIFSFQLSLPASIREADTNCPPPLNIYDVEFDENSATLPASRALTEPTGLSYFIIKSQIAIELGKIAFHTEVKDKIDHELITNHEQKLEEIRRNIPEALQILPAGIVAIDTHYKKRIGIDRLLQACKCILHRPFLSQARRDPSCLQNRRACIDSAMTLLSHQATFYLESGSQFLQIIKYRHMLILTTHDFFIAGMAVALDLYYGCETTNAQALESDTLLWGYDRRPEMINALEMSVDFWKLCKEDSIEAAKAYGMFCFVLVKVKKALSTSASVSNNGSNGTSRINASEITPTGYELNESDPSMLPDLDWVIRTHPIFFFCAASDINL